MPDYASINGVAAADIASINGVSKAGIATVSGAATPASGASRWVIATGGGYIAYANNSDLTSWTSYDGTDNSSPKALSIAYGRNASGAGIYVCTRDASTREIQVSGVDVSTDAVWSDIDISPNKDQRAVMWGAASNGATAGIWMTVGQDGSIYRSTDGAASWSAVDMSSTNLGSGDLKGIASNGSGKWMFAQSSKLYISTDDGASFTETTPWGTNTPSTIQGITYTNNSWIVAYSRSGIKLRLCADSDTTDWSDEIEINNSSNFPDYDYDGDGSDESLSFGDPGTTDTKYVKFATFQGRVVAVSNGGTGRSFIMFNVNGKTLSNGTWIDPNNASSSIFNGYDNDKPQDIACDGNTWVMSMTDGDVFKTNTADASNGWTKVVDNFLIDGNQLDFIAITGDVVQPL